MPGLTLQGELLNARANIRQDLHISSEEYVSLSFHKINDFELKLIARHMFLLPAMPAMRNIFRVLKSIFLNNMTFQKELAEDIEDILGFFHEKLCAVLHFKMEEMGINLLLVSQLPKAKV